MNRLEKLKIEKAILKHLALIPFGAREMINRYYDNEIDAIEKYGSPNNEIKEELVERMNMIPSIIEGGIKDESEEAK